MQGMLRDFFLLGSLATNMVQNKTARTLSRGARGLKGIDTNVSKYQKCHLFNVDVRLALLLLKQVRLYSLYLLKPHLFAKIHVHLLILMFC